MEKRIESKLMTVTRGIELDFVSQLDGSEWMTSNQSIEENYAGKRKDGFDSVRNIYVNEIQ